MASHSAVIVYYITSVALLRDKARVLFDQQKTKEIKQYNRRVQSTSVQIGDLAMLYQKKVSKLEIQWRDPFIVSGLEGTHGISYTLRQLNGRGIRGTFHGDYFKLFVSRSGHLFTGTEISISIQQTL